MKYNINQSLNRMYDIRQIYDLKQKEIARRLKIGEHTYSSWETNATFIPLNRLNEFCNLFHVSMDYIYRISRDKDDFKRKPERIDRIRMGKRTEFVCKKHDLSRQDLANLLYCSPNAISRYIRGVNILPTESALELSRVFNISLDWLCGRK